MHAAAAATVSILSYTRAIPKTHNWFFKTKFVLFDFFLRPRKFISSCLEAEIENCELLKNKNKILEETLMY